MQASLCAVDGIVPPSSYPVPNILVVSKDDVSDWGVRERAEANSGHGRAKTDLCNHSREILGGKVDMHAEELCARIFLDRVF